MIYRWGMQFFYSRNRRICFSNALRDIRNCYPWIRASMGRIFSLGTSSSSCKSTLYIYYCQAIFVNSQFFLSFLILNFPDNSLKYIIRTIKRPQYFSTKQCPIYWLILILRSITCGCHLDFESFKNIIIPFISNYIQLFMNSYNRGYSILKGR